MALPEDQHAVQELTAQGTDEALADRVHPRSLDGRAHDSRVGGLEDGVEGCREVRSAIAVQAAVTARAPSVLVLRVGAQVDLAHAASMLALGAVGRPLRRAQLADGLVAAIFAALGAAGAAAQRRGAVCAALPGAAHGEP